MQLICDAVHEIPLAFTIHPADQNDYRTFPGALQQLAHAYPWLKPKYLLADKGYDSQKTHRILIRKRIIPIIDIRKPTAKDALYEGIYGPHGSPVCLGNAEMEYVRTDPSTGQHLFRCVQDGCHLKGQGLVPNCVDEIWVDPRDNPRVVGVVPRPSPLWKQLYKRRTSVERLNKALKYERGLEEHRVMRLKKIVLLSTLGVLTYAATKLTNYHTGFFTGHSPGKMRIGRCD